MPSQSSAYKTQQNKVWDGLTCGKVSCGPVVHTKHNTETDNIIKTFCSVFGRQTHGKGKQKSNNQYCGLAIPHWRIEAKTQLHCPFFSFIFFIFYDKHIPLLVTQNGCNWHRTYFYDKHIPFFHIWFENQSIYVGREHIHSM